MIIKKIRSSKFFNRLVALYDRLHLGRWGWVVFVKPMPVKQKQETFLSYVRNFNLETLVETGTNIGETVEALQNSVKDIYSIELDHKLWQESSEKFRSNPHIRILEGDSAKLFPTLLPGLPDNVLFWLDGHYSTGITSKGDLYTPIMAELENIFNKNFQHSVILIDDARCFVGRKDYPTMGHLQAFVKSRRPDWKFEVLNDIIRITPF